jgi:hypothetical protein
MRYVVCTAIALVCTALGAQTLPARPQFEVASVKPVGDDSHLSQITREFARSDRRPGQIPIAGPDRVRLQNWALLDLVAAAYSVRATQVSGPPWLSDQGLRYRSQGARWCSEGTVECDAAIAARRTLRSQSASRYEDRAGLRADCGEGRPQTEAR